MSETRDPVFDHIARAWRARDPMPGDLPDRILAAVADLADVADLAGDVELPRFPAACISDRSATLLGYVPEGTAQPPAGRRGRSRPEERTNR